MPQNPFMMNLIRNLFGGGPKADIAELLAEGATIVDVRTPKEFAGGHAKGAINIPLSNLGAEMNKIRQLEQPIITCCRSGQRSGIGASLLRKKGIEVYNGGSWQQVEKWNK